MSDLIVTPDNQFPNRSVSHSSKTNDKNSNDKSEPTLNLAILNCQSIVSKRASLEVFIKDHNPDVLVLSETWLSPDILSTEFLPHHYNVFRKDREDGYGGVLIAYKNSFACYELHYDSSVEIVVSKFILNKQSLIICSLYRPPNRDLEYMENLCQQLHNICLTNLDTPIWIAGDVNLPNIDWESLCIDNNTYPIALCEKFIELTSNHGFTQVVKSPTRGENILDIFLTNRPSLVNCCNVVPGISDHEAIVVQSSIVAPLQTTQHNIYLWNKADNRGMKDTALNLCNSFLENYSVSTNVEVLWEQFKAICLECLNYIPSKTINLNNKKQPWISRHIRRLSRKKQRLYNLAKLSQSPQHWQAYYKLKKEVSNTCRNAYNNYVSSLVENGHITKKLWSYIKHQRKDNSSIPPLSHNGSMHTDPSQKAEILNNFFASIFTNDTSTSPTLEKSHTPDIAPITVDIYGVKNLLDNLDPHKATGPDNIPTRLLKQLSAELAPVLTMVFQASLEQSHVPADWKTANIVPIHKNGSRNAPNNYRPISLTSICCKLLEHIIYSHMVSHFNSNQILSDIQHGFRQGRSCETQLLLTINDLAKNLDKNLQTDVILLDFSKAFDRVSHSFLIHKLEHYGIRGNLLTWLENFLDQRTQRVMIDGHFSSTTNVTSGVPQGSVLAPLLFLCFINDLPEGIRSRIKLYADDVLLYSTITSPDDCHQIQADLIILEQWAKKWSMTFNPSKCEFLRVTNRMNPIQMTYYIQNQQIKQVPHAKYLGVTIDQHLTWNEHVRQITAKANSLKCFLQRNIKSCPVNVKTICYQSMVRSILDYASIVWSPYTQKNIQAIESVQRRSARFVLNNYSPYDSVTDMLTNLGWNSLEHRRNELRLLMLYKIIHHIVDIDADDLLPPRPQYHSTRGHSERFLLQSTRINAYAYSFFPTSIRLWNALPEHVVTPSNFNEFKEQVAGLQFL